MTVVDSYTTQQLYKTPLIQLTNFDPALLTQAKNSDSR